MTRRNVPNIITLCRLASLPFVFVLYAGDAPGASWATAALVLVMALSDVADGFLARRYGWVTDLGRLLDPIADRVLFVAIVSMLLVYDTLPWWAVVPVIARDVLMLAGAAFMLFTRDEKPQILRGGKVANFVLICGIQLFIIDVRAAAWVVYSIGVTLYIVTCFWYVERQGRRWWGSRGAPSDPA